MPDSSQVKRAPRTGHRLHLGTPLARLSSVLLGTSLLGLACGTALHVFGETVAGNRTWATVGLLGGFYALWATADSLWRHRLGVDLIALLAVGGTVAVGEYLASAVIGVMLASGRSLEAWAAGRARGELGALLARAPKLSHRYRDGALETVPVDDLSPGDRLMVMPGEVVPADGDAVTAAVLDESALTGEALPVVYLPGGRARSGSVNVGGPFDLQVTASPSDSSYAGIVRMVREAASSQAPLVRLADRYALWFLMVSLALAGSAWAVGGAARAVAVLVVATPCPLILATPVALVSGLSRAARRGIVVKGGAVLERLAVCKTLIIDKTGTLTKGHAALVGLAASPLYGREEVLAMAASLEQASTHVLASAVISAARQHGCQLVLPERVEEVAGKGAVGWTDGRQIRAGTAEWAGFTDIPAWARALYRRSTLDGSATVFVTVDGEPAGLLAFGDPLRADAARTVRSLRRRGISRIVLATGDRPLAAERIGALVGVDEVLAQCSPARKLEVVNVEREKAPTIMVGDGINDAPALAAADVGVALGARGATASSEAGDVVLTLDRLDRVGEARAIAHRSRRIAVQSALAGIALSLAAMGVAALGELPPVWGALLQEAIDVAVVLNALRALRPARAEVPLLRSEAAIMARFQDEHEAVRADIELIRSAADSLGTLEAKEAVSRARRAYAALVAEVVPHEEAEEDVLYPVLDRLLGGSDPTLPMSRGHAEIGERVKHLGQLLDAIEADGLDEEGISELRRSLYGLHAVLKLHTDQEDESYLSISDN
jgi:heavy metal translocating P-type ATPase